MIEVRVICNERGCDAYVLEDGGTPASARRLAAKQGWSSRPDLCPMHRTDRLMTALADEA